MGACLAIFKTPKEEESEKLLNGENDEEGLDDSQKQNGEEAVRINIKEDNEDGNGNGNHSGEFDENDPNSNSSANPHAKVTLNDFDILKVIGEGSFGKVYMVSKKDTGKIYAMKQLKKSNLTKSYQKLKTIEEKNIMVILRNPFIVQLKYAFQTQTKLFIVMDFMQGGEMFYHIRKARTFQEDMAKFYVAELTLAIEYLHSKDTIYRDLKPENILLGADGHIKICDFGLSKQGVTDKDKTKTICGTPEYLAPEILLGRPHGKEVDWYSLGCVMYEFLSGAPPFYSRDKQQMYQARISSDIIKKPQFSKDAWDLLESLLQRDPKERFGNADQVKKHPFFKGIDWAKLAKKQVKPPFIPKLLNDKDLRFISSEFQKQTIYTPFTPTVGPNVDFEGFTYQQETSSINPVISPSINSDKNPKKF